MDYLLLQTLPEAEFRAPEMRQCLGESTFILLLELPVLGQKRFRRAPKYSCLYLGHWGKGIRGVVLHTQVLGGKHFGSVLLVSWGAVLLVYYWCPGVSGWSLGGVLVIFLVVSLCSLEVLGLSWFSRPWMVLR